MEIIKELKDISWQVPEEVYRADEALSYSTLSTYETVGFSGIDHLFDKKETPSLSFGSAVDTYLTDGVEAFNERYFMADFPSLGDKELAVAKDLYASCSHSYNSMDKIPATYILQAANNIGFQKNWRDDTRVKVLTERCSEYYNLMSEANGREILDVDTYNDVLNCVEALKNSPATCGYFADNDPLSPVRRYYQLKFKFTEDNVDYRSMADLIVVNYEKKIIYPIDLKTSSTPEWEFEKSFCKWHYYIQSRLYWRNIRANLDKDSYFKDFELANYRFVVINRKTLTPLVWEFPLTKSYGTLIDQDGNEIRDPFEIGKELRSYLSCRPPVPNGINQNGPNLIQCIKVK
jgi:hypothetical protein